MLPYGAIQSELWKANCWSALNGIFQMCAFVKIPKIPPPCPPSLPDTPLLFSMPATSLRLSISFFSLWFRGAVRNLRHWTADASQSLFYLPPLYVFSWLITAAARGLLVGTRTCVPVVRGTAPLCQQAQQLNTSDYASLMSNKATVYLRVQHFLLSLLSQRALMLSSPKSMHCLSPCCFYLTMPLLCIRLLSNYYLFSKSESRLYLIGFPCKLSGHWGEHETQDKIG